MHLNKFQIYLFLNIKMLALVHKKIFTTNKKQIVEYTCLCTKIRKIFYSPDQRIFSKPGFIHATLLQYHLTGITGTHSYMEEI